MSDIEYSVITNDAIKSFDCNLLNHELFIDLTCCYWLVFVCLFVCLFDWILYVPSTIFQLNRDGSSWVEPVLS